MRVALLAFHFAEYSARLALALAENNIVLMICNEENYFSECSSTLRKRLVSESNLIIVTVSHGKLRDFSAWKTAYVVRKALKEFGPDVVHLQEWLGDYVPAILFMNFNVKKIILTVHDHIAHSGADSKMSKRSLMYRKWIRKSANAIIVHGENIANYMRDNECSELQLVRSVPHGVLGADNNAGYLNLDDGATFLFFGRIEKYKGLGVLVDACELLNREGRVFRVVIAGRGNDLDRYRQRIALLDCVELREGYVAAEDIPKLFAETSAVLLPYIDATQSGVCAIAYAMGKPVIASRTGGIPEVVADGECGLLVEPGNPYELAVAMGRVLDDPVFLKRLSCGAMEMASGPLAWSNIAKKTAQIYSNLLI